MTFEEALKNLEERAALLRSGKLSLEESLKVYEECAKYHKICGEILENARQKIEVYRPDTGSVEEFEDA